MPDTPETTPCRCVWARSASEIIYHDTEWGVPNRDEHHVFEMLTLEGAQAGLSWETILNKRDGYRKLFKDFDPHKVARFTKRDFDRLMQDPSIVRNRLKIESTISNARATLDLYESGTTLSEFVWSLVDGTPIVNRFRSHQDIPAQTDLSKKLSRELKKRGFRFVGPTTMYAMMQAIGMVNDHTTDCFRHKQV
ncbi:MAG: DNA-3-methyladenine glycosylase I [Phycisphaerae bacterium]|nr:DNA-3-methyladenine glycosylase I [Phycisphaerae bacterium]MBM91973.1 DNA-3-methyladenine glycosylase I [Phycisphaerae bacterium]HCT46313.1 DNA-3-methyladenine glycosylase I [Phycisphaerales bacterium]